MNYPFFKITVCRRIETWQRRKLQPRKPLLRRLLARRRPLRRPLARRRLQPRRSNYFFSRQLTLRCSALAKWRIAHETVVSTANSGFFIAKLQSLFQRCGSRVTNSQVKEKSLSLTFASNAAKFGVFFQPFPSLILSTTWSDCQATQKPLLWTISDFS
jgi:hypothetical protein